MESHGVHHRVLLLSVVILLSCSITGCDQIATLKDYFFPQEKKSQPAQAPTKAQTSKPTNQNDKGPIAPNVLVKVGSWTLTIEEFNNRLQNLKQVLPEYDINDIDSKALILEELIRQQLLVMDADKTGLSRRPDIVEAVDEFRKTILVREVATKITESVKEVTLLDAQNYYNENKQFMVEPAEWKVSEIVVGSKDEAQGVLADILKGANFTETAKARSITQSATNGGSLGFITEVPFPEMGAELVSMEVGSVSKVIKGPEGFYIFKLDEKKGGEEKKFSEVQDDITTGLTIRKQQERLVNYIDNLWKQAKIYKNEDLLKTKINVDEKKAE